MFALTVNIDGLCNKALFVVETSDNLLIEVHGLMYLDSIFFFDRLRYLLEVKSLGTLLSCT